MNVLNASTVTSIGQIMDSTGLSRESALQLLQVRTKIAKHLTVLWAVPAVMCVDQVCAIAKAEGYKDGARSLAKFANKLRESNYELTLRQFATHPPLEFLTGHARLGMLAFCNVLSMQLPETATQSQPELFVEFSVFEDKPVMAIMERRGNHTRRLISFGQMKAKGIAQFSKEIAEFGKSGIQK
jgi:hypothetical protein